VIVRRFLLWAREASSQDRAKAVTALVCAYLNNELSVDDLREAETAILSLLDDPSPLVRRAIAEEFAGAERAPRSIILGLIQDQSDIASLVLAHSPLLTEADLVDAAAIGDGLCQRAIALRPHLGKGICAALAEIGAAEALVALAMNPTADVSVSSLERMIERVGDNGALREAVLGRRDCPLSLRKVIADRISISLTQFVAGCGWMTAERSSRIGGEACDRVAIRLAGEGGAGDAVALVAHLKNEGRLTAGLILRSLLTGEPALAEAAFADLSGLPLSRAAQLLHDRRGSGLRAIYRKAGLPESLLPAFAAAISALHEVGFASTLSARAMVTRRIVERVMIACDGLQGPDSNALMALLRRLDMEAAREEAREIAESLADDAALAVLIEADPNLLVELDVIDHQQAA
jgi:uncharacterized protein (DUF2336 family)